MPEITTIAEWMAAVLPGLVEWGAATFMADGVVYVQDVTDGGVHRGWLWMSQAAIDGGALR